MSYDNSTPPDTCAASGPASVIETVNTEIAIYNKTGTSILKDSNGASVPFLALSTFFSAVGATTFESDPVVAYNELIGKFFVGIWDYTTDNGQVSGNITSNRYLYAVSNTSSPTRASDFSFYQVSLTANDPIDPTHTQFWGDFPRMGWNANEFAITFNMYTTGATENFDHVLVLNIDSTTPAHTNIVDAAAPPSGYSNFTLTPAVMHGSSSSDPMYFVEEALNSSNLNPTNGLFVVTEVNPFDPTPTFNFPLVPISVSPYIEPPSASQRGTGSAIQTNDSRVLDAEWRGNHLVATHTVGLSSDGFAHARWYEFDTSSTPAILQSGTITTAFKNTYFPSIALGFNDTIALDYIQSSGTSGSREYMSMYATGRIASDAAGTMETPVLVQAGAKAYSGFDGAPYRAGDFSNVTVDPSDGTFWAANEYATSASGAPFAANWGTAIGHFNVDNNRLIESFDFSQIYTLALPPDTTQPSEDAAHEGGIDYGMINYPGSDWNYRADSAAQVKEGDSVFAWLNFHTSVAGQSAAFAFGATSLANGYANQTNAVVVSSGAALVIETQTFTGTPTTTLLTTPGPGAILANDHWYLLEVDWSTSGRMKAELYDSNGTTLIESAQTTAAGFTAPGGVGFHATATTGNDPIFWDTITAISQPGVNNFSAVHLGGTVSGAVGPGFNRAIAQFLTALTATPLASLPQTVDSYFANRHLDLASPIEIQLLSYLAHQAGTFSNASGPSGSGSGSPDAVPSDPTGALIGDVDWLAALERFSRAD
jgi:hypothetical protein